MTPSRTRFWIALIVAFEFSSPSYAQSIEFTISQPVTRVNVPPSALTVTAQQSGVPLTGNLRPAYPICIATNSSKAGQATPDSLAPDELKARLAQRLERRTGAQVQTLATEIGNEPDPAKKFTKAFRSEGSQWTGPSELRSSLPASAHIRLVAGLESTLPDNFVCFSAIQLDQINAEVLRVMRAIVQALSPAPAQATQKPVTPGMGIGIQKPQ